MTGIVKDIGGEVHDHRVSWRRVVRTFAPDLWRHRGSLAGSYTCGFLAACVMAVAPWPLKFVIDHVLGSVPAPGWFVTLSAQINSTWMIAILTCAAALIAIAAATLSALGKNIDARTRERLGMELRDRLLGHIQALPLAHRNTDQSGELVLRLVDDVFHFVRLLTKTLPVIFQHVTTSAVTFVAMFLIEPLFGLLGMAVVAVLGGLTLCYAKRLRRASQNKRLGEGQVAGLAQEIIRGLASTRALGAEAEARSRFAQANARSLNAGVQENRISVGMERTMEAVKGLGVALIMGGGALLVLGGDLTVGGLTVGMAYLTQLLKPVAKISETASSVSRGLARGERLLALFARVPEFVEAPDAIDIGHACGEVELRNVSYAYPHTNSEQTTPPVLKAVNLKLEPGSFTVVVGPSGAGKSTLLCLILRLFDPTCGEVQLDGWPISKIRIQSLRAQFSVMLQETHLFAGTLREALQTGGRTASEEDIWNALGYVALDDFVDSLPEKLDSRLGENGVNLSGGQRARLSLARALLFDAPVLLLDEPLANVDQASQQVILDALRRIRGKRTCLAVTHQMALADLADVVLELDGQGLKQLELDGSNKCVTPMQPLAYEAAS